MSDTPPTSSPPNSAPAQAQSLYRQRAMDAYRASKNQIVSPRFVSPRWSLFIWCVLGLLAAALVLMAIARLPVYAYGTAIVMTNREGNSNENNIGIFFSLPEPKADTKQNVLFDNTFINAARVARIRAGQPAIVRFEGWPETSAQVVTNIDSATQPPDQVRAQFKLSSAAGRLVNQPTRVGLILIDAKTAAKYRGAIGTVAVQVGEQRLLALLPVVGKWLEPQE